MRCKFLCHIIYDIGLLLNSSQETMFLDVYYTEGVLERSSIVEIPVSETIDSLKHRALEEFECGFIGDHFGIFCKGATRYIFLELFVCDLLVRNTTR